MSFAPTLRSSLALRLTLWYAAIFALSSALAFAIVYAVVGSLLAERTDEELRHDADEYAQHWRREGVDRVRHEMQLDTLGGEARKSFVRLWSSDGGRLAATDLGSWPDLAHQAPLDPGRAPRLETLRLAGHESAVRTLVATIAPGIRLEIGHSLEENDELRREILDGFVLGLALVLPLGGVVGWFMARRALRGVNAVTRTATEIAGGGALDRRVPLGIAGDEIDELARTFNAMLDRMQALITGMRDVTDNLAHDLRSPLGRIRACAEMSLAAHHRNTSANADANGAWAADAIEECDRLLEMLETTLDIAEADSGAARLDLGSIDFAEIVRGGCELFQPVAEDRRVRIVPGVPEHCWIEGDRQRLQRVIANLLDNALKYTPAGGEVRITLREQPQRVLLTIEDTGVGIAADEVPRIFQRFYRCDPSRSGPGIGLGLSLALAFVRAHRGDITVASTRGRGSTFTVTLPQPARPLAPPGGGVIPALAGSR
jgi:signal transduction histidine kinase